MNLRTLAGVAALIVTTALPAAAETVLRFNNFLPRTSFLFYGVLEPWAEAIGTATEGRVKVEFTATSLGAPPAQFDLVRDGIADMALSIAGYTPDRLKLVQIAEMPFTGTGSEGTSVALWRVYEKYFAAADEFKGVKLMGMLSSLPSHLYTLKGPITSLADVKGLKVRVSGPVPGAVAEAIGAVPVGAPGVKVPEMLNSGVIDGTFFSHDGVVDTQTQDTIRYVTEFPKSLFNATFYVMINPASWDKLSPEDQAAIWAVSGEAFGKTGGAAFDEFAAKALQVLKDAGETITPAAPELVAAVDAVGQKLRADWIAGAAKERGVDGQAALDMLNAELAK